MQNSKSPQDVNSPRLAGRIKPRPGEDDPVLLALMAIECMVEAACMPGVSAEDRLRDVIDWGVIFAFKLGRRTQ